MKNTLNLERYHDWLDKGRNFSDIRYDLEQKGYAEEDIKQLIKLLDNEQIERHYRKRGYNEAKAIKIAGYVLAGISVLLTAYFYFAHNTIAIYTLLPGAAGGALQGFRRS